MDLQLQGKHVFIAGGSRGIGLACAREFVREGCTVSLVGRDPQRVERARVSLEADPKRSLGFSADLGDSGSALRVVDEAEQKGGPIDILVNCAGAARRTPFAELDPQAWHDAIQAKFLTYINVMDPLIKRMGARGTGAVVNIVGMGGKIPSTTHLAGGAANAALMLASAGLALAYGPRGVRVNAINPSRTATDRLAQGAAADARQGNTSAESVLTIAKAELPLGRFAAPEDVAAAVVFLASPRAGYISGAILSMDGAARPMVV